MRHVPIAELQDRASEIAAAVELGEEIVLTRDGHAFLKLVAIENSEERQARKRAVIAAAVATREALRAKGVSISTDELIAWKNEGRR